MYELHITIRLVKLVYVDNKSISAIGEQPFFKLPTFEKYVLAKLYDDLPSGECKN